MRFISGSIEWNLLSPKSPLHLIVVGVWGEQSSWLAPLCGMGFLCRKDCYPGFFLTHFTLASKLYSLAVQGSAALLSSNLEGALYKSP